MSAEPYITLLAREVSAGSDRIFTYSRAAEVHHVTLEPDTPREETVRVRDVRGFWPHLVLLGYGFADSARLRYAHEIGAVVRFEPVSPELAAARLRAAQASCWHPDAVPVRSLDDELVASLCPNCDEMLPAEWLPEGVAAQDTETCRG